MYILTVLGKEEKGAYSVDNSHGERVLYIFEEEDDAIRYSLMLESGGAPKMHVMEVEDDVMLKTCDIHHYKYSIISHNDVVIPPKDIHDFV